MPECENVHRCVFFNDVMGRTPGTGGLFKRNYCQGDFASCARHRVHGALGGSMVPRDLFPNQSGRADEIIGQARDGQASDEASSKPGQDSAAPA